MKGALAGGASRFTVNDEEQFPSLQAASSSAQARGRGISGKGDSNPSGNVRPHSLPSMTGLARIPSPATSLSLFLCVSGLP